ncbi:MAG: hypothetical protein D6812_11525 [Deltaproteobacteria bacterium]|nr:MAG: hypothetical protein D6812_11525 [Deltaproteobacteria bacterium]
MIVPPFVLHPGGRINSHAGLSHLHRLDRDNETIGWPKSPPICSNASRRGSVNSTHFDHR